MRQLRVSLSCTHSTAWVFFDSWIRCTFDAERRTRWTFHIMWTMMCIVSDMQWRLKRVPIFCHCAAKHTQAAESLVQRSICSYLAWSLVDTSCKVDLAQLGSTDTLGPAHTKQTSDLQPATGQYLWGFWNLYSSQLHCKIIILSLPSKQTGRNFTHTVHSEPSFWWGIITFTQKNKGVSALPLANSCRITSYNQSLLRHFGHRRDFAVSGDSKKWLFPQRTYVEENLHDSRVIWSKTNGSHTLYILYSSSSWDVELSEAIERRWLSILARSDARGSKDGETPCWLRVFAWL